MRVRATCICQRYRYTDTRARWLGAGGRWGARRRQVPSRGWQPSFGGLWQDDEALGWRPLVRQACGGGAVASEGRGARGVRARGERGRRCLPMHTRSITPRITPRPLAPPPDMPRGQARGGTKACAQPPRPNLGPAGPGRGRPPAACASFERRRGRPVPAPNLASGAAPGLQGDGPHPVCASHPPNPPQPRPHQAARAGVGHGHCARAPAADPAPAAGDVDLLLAAAKRGEDVIAGTTQEIGEVANRLRQARGGGRWARDVRVVRQRPSGGGRRGRVARGRRGAAFTVPPATPRPILPHPPTPPPGRG